MARISVQGQAVLTALAETRVGLSVAALSRCVGRPGTWPSVTRASLSRTLRRLWSAEFVELQTGSKTFTELQHQNADRAARIVRDPEAEYEGYLKWIAGLNALMGGGARPSYGSTDALRRAAEGRTQKPPRGRVRTVSITKVGLAAVNTPAGATVNRPGGVMDTHTATSSEPILGLKGPASVSDWRREHRGEHGANDDDA